MKVKLTNGEYAFFISLVESIVENTKPSSINTLAVLSILKQVYSRLHVQTISTNKKHRAINLKDYEAIFVYKLVCDARHRFAAQPYESNVLRKISSDIHQKIIAPNF